MLHEFLESNRDEIIARSADRGRHRVPTRTGSGVPDGIPLFLEQLTTVLGGEPPSQATRSPRDALAHTATANGQDQLRGGLTVEQVVRAYGDVCQVVTELATEQGVRISTQEFKMFNGCLDDATAHAVAEYVTQRERASARADTERLGTLAHEMRNHLSAAMLSFDAIRTGQVGLAGRTSEVHARSLTRLRELIDRSLAEVRLDAGLHNVETIEVADILEEIEATLALQAKSRGLRLIVPPVAPELRVRGDRQTIAAVIANLVHNAIKFTKAESEVTIRTSASSTRVTIEVEDECGGIANEKLEQLFAPFAQGADDRTGLGLGLAICRRGAAANSGEVRARSLPGKGCVFALELPRFVAPG